MSQTPARVLVIDDEKSVCLSCRRILEEEGHHVDFILSGKEGVRRAVQGDYELVLLDLKMPDMSGMEALEQIKAERPDVSVVIITGYATIQTSIEAIKKGAYNYVPKPFTPEELAVAVSKALEHRSVRSENEYLRQELSSLRKGSRLLGRSKAMEAIRRQILKIAPSNFTITLTGESGTGKELVAREIHEHSLRAGKPFVAVDVSSLSPTLIESELFGHVKGAFTGAAKNRPGHFAMASGGTLFLDEVANISLELQGKLLRVIETRKVIPVGSETEHDVDVRLIAATNRQLHEMVEQGTFREDLYYRLNVIPVTIPPLRERADDIPLLASYFLNLGRENIVSNVQGFSTEAMARMIAWRWPGNVRELRNVVERLMATVDQELVQVEHLPTEIIGVNGGNGLPELDAVPTTNDELKEVKHRLRDRVYEAVEKQFVLAALDRGGWNVTRTATLVGMQRTNFHALMRKCGIRVGLAKGEEGEEDELLVGA